MPFIIKTDTNKADLLDNEVRLSDFNEGFHNFRSRYFHLENGTLIATPCRVDWLALSGLMASVPNANALTVYHGLRNDQLVWGFRAVNITRDDISPDLDTAPGWHPTHELTSTGLLKQLPLNEWNTPQRDYYATVHLDRSRSSSRPSTLNAAWDPKCVTFMWSSELVKMRDWNLGKLTIGEQATLMISHYAMYHNDEVAPRPYNGPHGLRHSVCFYMQKLNPDGSLAGPMLNDDNAASPAYMYGLNLGHLCPPRCRKTTDPGAA